MEDGIMDDGGLEGCIEELGKLAKDKSPYLSMEFPSEEAAYEFYDEFGRIVRFSIIRDYCNKSKKNGVMTSRKFVCYKEGEREKDKRYTGINIDIADETGISLKASHDLISAIAGGKEFVRFTREDQKTYLHAKRQRNLQYGETGSLLRYFQQQVTENPYFYYAIQLDVDEMITNIFGADHQIITDYGLFGDVVSFNTTFRTNKEYRSLVLFYGFNHFRMTVIFGAALLYDEIAKSFEWLFETFLDAMLEKKPISFFTDQDQAMAKAISQIMPEVFHGLCTFHLMQNSLKHLGYSFKSGSKFSSDLKACIYAYKNEHELIEAWNSLMINITCKRMSGWKELGEKQSSGRMYKQYEEISAIYDFRQKLPRMKLKKSPILIQQFNELEEVKCVFGLYGNNEEYIVEGRVEVIGLRGEKNCRKIHCTCKKFENFGILCSRAIKALNKINVIEIPKRYILGQWRLDAKDCQVEEENFVVDEDDPKLLILVHYRDLCLRMLKLATQASVHKPAYQLVDEGIKELCVKVNNLMKGVGNFGTKELDVEDPNFAQVKGIKKKDVGHKGRGRLKPWHEMMNKKIKIISQPTRLSKTIDQSSNTTNVQNSSSSQPQTIGQSSNITNVQNSSLSQPQEISLNLPRHNPMETEFKNESSFDFSIYSQPPPQN
ncbi:protein FAR-RED IMPAIRED RESPONSE 1-like [Camellia sinensis]|uniref:protein FAR-RED IMPAIRED RESPONSE 1-like n=1 Tax=Camellia sinensis TaxID=4442 RepID=UPI001035B290|nr:protein FAR-RED IMPAIRED RESPONSE 1-like [Camellia sinensis]